MACNSWGVTKKMSPVRRRNPKHVFWIPGKPLSGNSASSGNRKYKEMVRNCCLQQGASLSPSNKIEVVVFFAADRRSRPDVDNVMKPILDALKGCVYEDDQQVWSIRCTALPLGESYGISGPMPLDVVKRIGNDDEFLIEIFEEWSTP